MDYRNSLRERTNVRRVAFAHLFLLLFLAVAACGEKSKRTAEGDSLAGATPSDVKAMTVTPADFAQLRWLEGSWRGHGIDQPPFYERYRFADESTLVVDHFADSTFASVTGTSRVELRGGQLVNEGEGARWVATALDSAQVIFAPLERATNSFTWRRGRGADHWRAIMNWNDASGAPKERVYEMERRR